MHHRSLVPTLCAEHLTLNRNSGSRADAREQYKYHFTPMPTLVPPMKYYPHHLTTNSASGGSSVSFSSSMRYRYSQADQEK